MKKFFETTPSILEGIEQRDLPCLLNSLGAHRRSYARGEAVSHVGSRCIIGVLLSGRVQIVQEDLWGNRSVIGTAGTGELFGEAFACAGLSQMPVGVFCIEPAELLLLDGTRLSGLEPSPARQRLNENLLRILAGKAVALIQKNAFVSRRTTREKLLSYLSAQARQAGSPAFTIPFDRQQLADYLRKYADELGHTPWPREIPGGVTIQTRFGSWEAAVAEAGLPFPKHPNQPGKFRRVREETQRQRAIYRQKKAEKRERAKERMKAQEEKRRKNRQSGIT